MALRSLGHRAPLLWIVVPLCVGLAAARQLSHVPVVIALATAVVGAGAGLWAAWRDSRLWSACLALTMIAAGVASYGLHRARLEVWDALPPREATVAVRVDRLFGSAKPPKVSGIGTITRATPTLAELVGQRVYFSAVAVAGVPPPQRSALFRISGLLTPVPPAPPADTFDGYLASAGVNFRLGRGRLLGQEQPAHAYYQFCAAAGDRFNAILGRGIAAKRPDLAGLFRAMMLGETSALSEEQHTLYMQSGTMHLFAISGMNIAVIAGSLQALLSVARLSPWARFLAGTPLLWLFVDITGAAPSAVRAFAMAIFFHGAFVGRRPANPLAALAGSAAIVLLIAPLQLFSASFLMSYAIVAALLVLGLPLGETWLEKTAVGSDIPEPSRPWVLRRFDAARRMLIPALAIGVATTLVSTLTSVEFFKLLTPAALGSNLLLIPAASFVTLAGFFSLLCGLVGLGPIAVLCNHAAAVSLLAIEALVRWSVRVPGAFIAAEFKAPWICGAALTLLLATLLFGYRAHWHPRAGGWWPPFVVVALTLVLGLKLG